MGIIEGYARQAMYQRARRQEELRRKRERVILFFIGLVLYALLATLATPAEGQEKQITCKPVGRDFACVSIGAENLKIYPRWILHTKPTFERFGLEFTGRAPRRWTYITANFYSYDDGAEVQACIEVALIKGVAKLREPCRQYGREGE